MSKRTRDGRRTCAFCSRRRWRTVMNKQGDGWVCKNLRSCLRETAR